MHRKYVMMWDELFNSGLTLKDIKTTIIQYTSDKFNGDARKTASYLGVNYLTVLRYIEKENPFARKKAMQKLSKEI